MPQYDRSGTSLAVDACDQASSCASDSTDSMRDALALYLSNLKDLKRTLTGYRNAIISDLEKSSKSTQPPRTHSPTKLPGPEPLIDTPTGGSKEAIHAWLSRIALDGDEGSDTKAGIPTVPMAKLRGGRPIHAWAKKSYQGSNQVYKPSF
jgi:hypothetical protein